MSKNIPPTLTHMYLELVRIHNNMLFLLACSEKSTIFPDQPPYLHYNITLTAAMPIILCMIWIHIINPTDNLTADEEKSKLGTHGY